MLQVSALKDESQSHFFHNGTDFQSLLGANTVLQEQSREEVQLKWEKARV